MMDSKVVYCDKCGKEFAYQSIQIEECKVNVGDKVLLLEYFTCPFCSAVYKVLLVEETKYRELMDDFMSIQRRILKQQGNSNPMLLQKLQIKADKKHMRIERYVKNISDMYKGSFVLANGNNKDGKQIIYIP